MSSLLTSNSSLKSFDDIRKTAKENQYQIENEEDFIEMYNSDPFFKEKVDFKITETRKRISKNPSFNSSASLLKDVKNISFKLNKTRSSLNSASFMKASLQNRLLNENDIFYCLFTETSTFINLN